MRFPVRLWIAVLILVSASVAQDGAAAAGESSSRSGSESFLIEPVARTPERGMDLDSASRQSFYFLSIQHGLRFTQRKTRRELGGPFFADWGASVKGTQGWGDGDTVLTNYVGHPMQGAITGYVLVQNDRGGKKLEFGTDKAYWRSRLRAMAWSAAYSTQFEIGPYSEATIGNVGKRPGTGGYVDHVMTPVGGFALIVGEDALDRHVITKLENRFESRGAQRFFRVALNPSRSVANIMRGKLPWYRDTRGL